MQAFLGRFGVVFILTGWCGGYLSRRMRERKRQRWVFCPYFGNAPKHPMSVVDVRRNWLRSKLSEVEIVRSPSGSVRIRLVDGGWNETMWPRFKDSQILVASTIAGKDCGHSPLPTNHPILPRTHCYSERHCAARHQTH